MKTLIILILSFLLFSYSINAEEKKGALTTPDKNVEIEVLKERINALGDSARIKVLEERVKNYNEMTNETIRSYRNFAIIIIAILTLIGAGSIYAIIRNIVKEIATNAAKDKLETLVNKDEILKIVETESTKVIQSLEEEVAKKVESSKEKSMEIIDKYLSELDTEAKKRLSALDDRLARLESLQSEYITSLADLERKTIDLNKPMTKETIEEIEQFGEKVTQVKTEDKFTFDDWFYKAVSEYNHGNYDTTIAYLTKSLEKSPINPHAYSNRGVVYDTLTEESMK